MKESYSASIKWYSLVLSEYSLHIKHAPEEDLKKIKIEAKFIEWYKTGWGKKRTEILEFPLETFGDIVKARTLYKFEINWDKFNCQEMLLKILYKKGILIQGTIKLKHDANFYLRSRVKKQPIVVTNKKRLHTLETYSELLWIQKRGFVFG